MEQEILKLIKKLSPNITDEELNEILYTVEGEEKKLKDGFSDEIIKIMEGKIQSVKDSTKEEKENFYKKGQKEKAQELEAKFKEMTGIESDGLFDELVQAHIEQTGKKSKLTDDDVKKHPLYISLEKERIAKADYDRLSEEFNNYKSNVSRNELLSKINDKAWNIVESNKPKKPENTVVFENLKKSFLGVLGSYNYEINGDTIVVLDKDGKRLEDNLSNAIDFDKFVKSNADNWFEWNVTDARDGSGNKNTPPTAPPAGNYSFETKADWDTAFNAEKDAKKRVELGKYAREKGWLASG